MKDAYAHDKLPEGRQLSGLNVRRGFPGEGACNVCNELKSVKVIETRGLVFRVCDSCGDSLVEKIKECP